MYAALAALLIASPPAGQSPVCDDDVHRFPSGYALEGAYRLAEAELHRIDALLNGRRFPGAPYDWLGGDAASLAAARGAQHARWDVWDDLRLAASATSSECRRAALWRVRRALGDEAYYSGRMPLPLPPP